MKVFRLAKDRPGKYRADDISGNGAAITGGRWNPIGLPALYTSMNVSTAVLEVRVHASGLLPTKNLVLVEVDVPDALLADAFMPTLPADWSALAIPASTMALGREWLTVQRTVAMRVPSVVCPADWNVILNPLHPDYRQITVTRHAAFVLDARLFR